MSEVAELELPTQENFRTDLRALFRGAVRVALEEELREMVGARKWERQAQRVDSRNGTYLRRLVTSVPRVFAQRLRARLAREVWRVFQEPSKAEARKRMAQVGGRPRQAGPRGDGVPRERLRGRDPLLRVPEGALAPHPLHQRPRAAPRRDQAAHQRRRRLPGPRERSPPRHRRRAQRDRHLDRPPLPGHVPAEDEGGHRS
jgi:mutator family transposase